MSTRPIIDLSVLRFPSVTGLDARAAQSMPELMGAVTEGSLLGESILETLVMREAAVAASLNQAAKDVLLATAVGPALDRLSSMYGVKRMVIEPADTEASPPKEAVMETDERLRLRSRLSLQALSQTGCSGAYLFYAMSSSPHLKDISVFNSEHNLSRINVVILADRGRGDGGEEPQELLAQVEQVLQPICSVTDQLSVRWARVVEYRIHAVIEYYPQDDKAACHARVVEAVEALVARNHRLGKDVLRAELFAAMYQPGVERVRLLQPLDNLAISDDAVAYNSGDPKDIENFRIDMARDADIGLEAQQLLRIGIRQCRMIRLRAHMSENES